MDELLDLVDHNDHIGTIYRSKAFEHNIKNIRVINGFLINNKKEIWIPLRSPHKKMFPSCLDMSVGGFVSSGETYDQAFVRELQEELNIIISDVSYILLGKLTPHDGVSCFMQVYCINSNKTPDYNKNDFVDSAWYSIAELQKIVKSGVTIKGDLPELVNFLEKYL